MSSVDFFELAIMALIRNCLGKVQMHLTIS